MRRREYEGSWSDDIAESDSEATGLGGGDAVFGIAEATIAVKGVEIADALGEGGRGCASVVEVYANGALSTEGEGNEEGGDGGVVKMGLTVRGRCTVRALGASANEACKGIWATAIADEVGEVSRQASEVREELPEMAVCGVCGDGRDGAAVVGEKASDGRRVYED